MRRIVATGELRSEIRIRDGCQERIKTDELTDRLAGVLLVVLPLPVEDGRPVGEAGAPTGARHSETEERIS